MKSIFLIFVFFIFIISCDSYNDGLSNKKIESFQDQQMQIFIKYLTEMGIKNETNSFLNYLTTYPTDSINTLKFNQKLNFDSIFLIPSEVPISFVEEKTGLRGVPNTYMPNSYNLILFKLSGIYTGYCYSLSNNMTLDVSAKKIGFSNNDSTLHIFRKKYTNKDVEFIFFHNYHIK